MITVSHRAGLANDCGIPWILGYCIRNIISIDLTKNQIFSFVKKSFLGGGCMSICIYLYIRGYGQMITILHRVGGVSHDTRKWLRNMCTTPNALLLLFWRTELWYQWRAELAFTRDTSWDWCVCVIRPFHIWGLDAWMCGTRWGWCVRDAVVHLDWARVRARELETWRRFSSGLRLTAERRARQRWGGRFHRHPHRTTGQRHNDARNRLLPTQVPNPTQGPTWWGEKKKKLQGTNLFSSNRRGCFTYTFGVGYKI